jgi:hypothetical protein
MRSRWVPFVGSWRYQEEEGAIIKGDYVDTRVTGERSTELVRHADQSCVSDNATSYEWPDSTVEVCSFLDSLRCMKSTSIVTAAVI